MTADGSHFISCVPMAGKYARPKPSDLGKMVRCSITSSLSERREDTLHSYLSITGAYDDFLENSCANCVIALLWLGSAVWHRVGTPIRLRPSISSHWKLPARNSCSLSRSGNQRYSASDHHPPRRRRRGYCSVRA